MSLSTMRPFGEQAGRKRRMRMEGLRVSQCLGRREEGGERGSGQDLEVGILGLSTADNGFTTDPDTCVSYTDMFH